MKNSMDRRKFLIGSGAIASAAFVSLSPKLAAAADNVTLRLSTYLPSQHPMVTKFFKPWADEVEAITSGRVSIAFSASSLAPPPRQFDMVTDGLANVSFTTHSYTPSRFPLTGIAELPFLGNKSEATSVAYWRVYEKLLKGANEHKGLKLLGLSTHGPGALWTNKGPINSLADLKGMKLVVPGGLGAKIADALGVVPVQAPAPKWYEYLSRGVADGALFSVDAPVKFKLEKFLPYYTRVPGGLFNNSFAFFMGQDAWDSISAEDQALIEPLTGEILSRRMGVLWDAGDAHAISRFPETGAQIKEVEGAFLDEIKKVVAPVEAGWIEAAGKSGVDGAAALALFRSIAAEETAKLKS